MLIENNETFLSELTKMFQKSQDKSLYITMKRYDGRNKPKPRNTSSTSSSNTVSQSTQSQVTQQTEYKCLIRAHNNKRKISTIISAKDVNKFQLAYANLLKGNLYGLKKRDNKKKSGTKSKSKATQ